MAECKADPGCRGNCLSLTPSWRHPGTRWWRRWCRLSTEHQPGSSRGSRLAAAAAHILFSNGRKEARIFHAFLNVVSIYFFFHFDFSHRDELTL